MRIRFAVTNLAILTVSCSLSYAQKSDISLQELKHGIEDNEKKLRNVRVDGTCLTERLNQKTQQWEFHSEDRVVAWYDGVPLGKRRVDHLKSVSRWTDGPSPFLEQTYIRAYDGRVTQSLWTRSGSPNSPSLAARGEIEKGMPPPLLSEFATGWAFSIYGGFEESGRLSTVFRLPSNQLQVRGTNFNGVSCVQLQVILGGVRAITCYFDPARGYGILGCERASGDGVVHVRWTVERFAEPAPGIYYPSKGVREFISGDGAVRERESYEASTIVINDPSFSDDLFTIKWPPKTKVRDLIAGTTFIITGDEQNVAQGIRAQVERIRPGVVKRSTEEQASLLEQKVLAKDSTRTRTIDKVGLWVIIVAIAILGAVGIVVSLRMNKRR